MFNTESYKTVTLLPLPLPYPTPWETLCPYKKLIVEIGTGHGETIRHLSSHNRNSLVIGFEKTTNFAKMTAKRLQGAPNAKVIAARAYELVPHLFADASIDELYILFPDPWHKKRHAKRRPLTTEFFMMMHRKLAKNGFIFIATDWPDYYAFICDQLAKVPSSTFHIAEGDDYEPERFGLVPTHYYEKWQVQKRRFYWVKVAKA